MRVLVGYATDHGSTAGIAERIADRLRSRGLDVGMGELASMATLQGFDAAVLGSAIHTGRWLPEGSRVLLRQRGDLRGRPVWLFSVSSVGATSSFFPSIVARALSKMRGETKEIAGFRKSFAVRGHRNFAGVIEPGDWSRAGDLFLRLLGGHMGDHRDWVDIDAWADAIAVELATVRLPASV